jgi:hypothetical protein
MTEKITEPGQTGSSYTFPDGDDAAERARRHVMTKGTAGAAETGD